MPILVFWPFKMVTYHLMVPVRYIGFHICFLSKCNSLSALRVSFLFGDSFLLLLSLWNVNYLVIIVLPMQFFLHDLGHYEHTTIAS